MTGSEILNLVILIVVVFLAFRIGAFLMKGLLGLLAIGLLVWLVMSLVNGRPPDLAFAAPWQMGVFA
jgi:uncharacterized membrane protein